MKTHLPIVSEITGRRAVLCEMGRNHLLVRCSRVMALVAVSMSRSSCWVRARPAGHQSLQASSIPPYHSSTTSL